MSEVGSENDLKARGIQYTKLERLFNYCIKVFGPCPFLHRLIEDLKAQDQSLEDLVVKYATILREILD